MTVRPIAVLALTLLLATAAAACDGGDEGRTDAAAGGPDPADTGDEPTTSSTAPLSATPSRPRPPALTHPRPRRPTAWAARAP